MTNERFGALWMFEAQITRPGNILPREQVVTITGPGQVSAGCHVPAQLSPGG